MEWQVPEYRRKDFPSPVALRILRDAQPGERGDLVQDVPVSFSPEYRQYAAREVVTVEPLVLENPQGRKLRVTESSSDEESSESPAEPDFLNVVVEA